MTTDLARRAGSAVVWRGLALGGEKLIFLLRLLILARLLQPEDFGLVAIGMAALGLAVSLTDFGVVAALVQQPAESKRHLDTAWTISLVRGGLVTLALLVSAPWVAQLFAEPRATPFIQALSVTALLRAAASIRIASLNRDLHFGRLAGVGLGTAVVNTVVAIALAPRFGAWALVWGGIAGAAAYMLGSFIAAPYRPMIRFSGAAAGTIVGYGRWIFLAGVLGVLGDAVIRWIVATRLGVEALGLFFLAARLAYLPAQLISELVGTVAFPVFARMQLDRGKATLVFRKLLISTLALMIPACLVFAWLVPGIVEHVLGERWQGATAVMQLLILGCIVGSLGDSVVPLLKGLGEPRRIVVLDLVQLLFVGVLGWFLVGPMGLAGVGAAWLLAILVSQYPATVYARRLLARPFSGCLRPFLAVLGGSLAGLAAAAATTTALAGAPGLALAAVLAVLATLAATLALDRQLDTGLAGMLVEPFPWLQRFARTGGADR